MAKRSGRKSESQTPAPKKDKIYGSKVNPEGSASSEQNASQIQLGANTLATLVIKLSEFKKSNPDNKNVTLNDLKAVYRRGAGAYSSTHRPTITGGKPNTRNAWAMARVNKFLEKASGKKVKKAYVQDDDLMSKGGTTDENNETYQKWKSLVNMSRSELESFYNSEEGREAGLSSSEAKEQGIDSGRESARWIMKMKDTPHTEWTPTMWKWAKKQISFISRMRGNKGDLYDDKGNKTRKHTSLLIWGHNPKKYSGGGDLNNLWEIVDPYCQIPKNLDATSITYNSGGSTTDTLNDIVFYYEEKGNFIYPKGTFYAWLYDHKGAGDKLSSGEYDYILFPMGVGMGYAMQKGYVPPLLQIWDKKFQKDKKGIEHLLGIVQGYYDEDNKKVYIEMMTTNPKFRRQGINGHIIKELRDIFEVGQDDLIFDKPTKEGKKFMESKKYDYGGELEKLGITEEEVKDWQDKNAVNNQQKQNPKVMESAKLLSEGKITQSEYLRTVIENQPIKPFTEVPQIPTLLEIVGSLKTNQVETGIIGYTKFLQDGEMVATRLDIPAYNNYDVWIVSVHDAKEKHSIGYGQTALLKDVTFLTSPKKALRIATGLDTKTTFARMRGSWINEEPEIVRDMAIKYMKDPQWVQVGMNPYRHSWFYDKSDGMPLLSAEEVIQVGALVLAKNPVKTTPDDDAFIVDKNKPSIKFKSGGDIDESMKPYKTPEQIAQEKNVPLSYVYEQLEKGIEVESEHSNSPELQRIIALQHIDEIVNYYDKLEKMENFKNGGNLDYDNKEVKQYFAHGSGNAGGVLVGRRHSEGGIKAINKSTGQPLEMEGGEVVITRKAVSDNTKREFEGEMLTNKEILSRINQSGGGVKIFSDGGDIESHTCSCSGKSYQYGGKTMLDYDILKDLSGYNNQSYYNSLSHRSYEEGGTLETENLNATEKYVLHKLNGNVHKKCDVRRDKVKELKTLTEAGIIYVTPSENHSCYEARLTDYGADLIEDVDIETLAKGGSTADDCGCHSSFKDGGGVETVGTYFKGIKAEYRNQFELNKAIEEFIDTVPASEMTPEEKNFVGYYAGYGGLEKYGATGKGLLYEYFTPSKIAKKMWALAYKHGYKGGKVLEPSCGIGEFIKYAPEQALVTGYEINETSAKICRVLYPEANIQSKYFETLFIKNNTTIKDKIQGVEKYSLVIGNPPYGSMGGKYAGMGEKAYTKANNYIEYFISRGLDLLEKGGLLIYIIGTEVSAGGTPLLMQGMTEAKKIIAEKSTLLDAYRLPNGLFETTDVVTDIIVLMKK